MKWLTALVVVGLFLLLSGCECMSGLGRDIQHAGHWLEKTASGDG
ncbi:MAG: entericidin A/B family lipoprotein [Desulfuromonas sp.]|nr:entericidin A/B family lipoprotein [Desulfuromonas sp.]